MDSGIQPQAGLLAHRLCWGALYKPTDCRPQRGPPQHPQTGQRSKLDCHRDRRPDPQGPLCGWFSIKRCRFPFQTNIPISLTDHANMAPPLHVHVFGGGGEGVGGLTASILRIVSTVGGKRAELSQLLESSPCHQCRG